MVIGNGLVANAFSAYKNDDRFLVFASGVSNSANKDLQAFEREKTLLENSLAANKQKHFVYFSTCSLYDSSLQDSLYVKHKLEMETLIKSRHTNYNIFRVSNLAGNTSNPNTILNFFYRHIANGISFNVWKDAARNIIDIDDALLLCDHIIKHDFLKNETVNIANPHNYKVLTIISVIEQILHKKGNYKIVERSSVPHINTKTIEVLTASLKINFNEDYLQRTLNKYYAQS